MTGISLGSSPITGVYVGSTLATGVYLGSTKLWPADSGIVPVGSQATAQTINFGSSQTSQTLACALPSGCVAGDLAVLSCEAHNIRSFAWVAPTGAGTALAPTVFGSSSGQCAVYLYTLTPTDVDAGTVGVPCTATASSSVQATVEVDVRRGVSQTNIDVVGTLATGTLGASPANAAAPGITTLRDGDLLQYCLFLDNGNVVNAVTPPAGWTGGEFPVLPGTSFAITGYMAQSTAGATGNITPTVAYSTTAPDYAIVLLALRKKAPAITLSATFPSNLHVGDTGSFVVTATRVDGATGTLTITGSSLPDGMTVGTTINNSDGTSTATVDYDLTTVQDVTSTFRATGGSVAATPLTHEFDVQAAASGLTLVSTTLLQEQTGLPAGVLVPIGTVQAGDQVIVSVSGTAAANQTMAFADSQGNTFDFPQAATCINSLSAFCSRTTVSANTSNYSVTLTGGSPGTASIVAYVLRGKTLKVDTVVSNFTQGSQCPLAYSASAGGFIALIGAAYQGAAQTFALQAPSSFTPVDVGDYRQICAHRMTTGAVSGTETLTGTAANPTLLGLIVPYIPA